MKFKVTVKFDRLNVEGKIETSTREGTLEAKDQKNARSQYLKIFRKNEPNRRKIHSVKIIPSWSPWS